MILLNQKRIAEAEQAVKKGLQYASDSPIGHYYLGRISLEAGNTDQALASFDRAITVNPAFEPAYLAQASVLESRQEKDKAIVVLKRYLEQVNPRNRDTLYLHASDEGRPLYEELGFKPTNEMRLPLA